MKLLALSTLGYMLAQVTAPALGDIGPFAQLGAVGVMAWATKVLLVELRDARLDSAKQRTEQATILKEMSETWRDESEKTRAVMLQMVEQCSAARRNASDLAERTAEELMNRQRVEHERRFCADPHNKST